MGSISIVIVLIGVLLIFLYYNYKKNTHSTAKNKFQAESIVKTGFDNNKNQIIIELEKIRSTHLVNLINYYVTLFSQTELDNQSDRNKIAEIYPKTLSREPFNFTYLYENYNANLVNECIIELIDKYGNLEIDNFMTEPFLKFEFFVKKEAELKARNIFNDYSKKIIF